MLLPIAVENAAGTNIRVCDHPNASVRVSYDLPDRIVGVSDILHRLPPSTTYPGVDSRAGNAKPDRAIAICGEGGYWPRYNIVHRQLRQFRIESCDLSAAGPNQESAVRSRPHKRGDPLVREMMYEFYARAINHNNMSTRGSDYVEATTTTYQRGNVASGLRQITPTKFITLSTPPGDANAWLGRDR